MVEAGCLLTIYYLDEVKPEAVPEELIHDA